MSPCAAFPSRIVSTLRQGSWRRTLFVLLAALAAQLGHAQTYTLWIHGRNGGGQVGNHSDFTYWGSASVAAGVEKRSVNWDGYNRISVTNGVVRDALDCYCTGPNWCHVAAHSAGDNHIGYALAHFGGSQRPVKNAIPNAAGVCGSTGASQTGWNIKWVAVAGGSGGGTELANIGSWAVSDPLTSDLKTSTARAMYDHNQTRGKWFYMFAGAKGNAYAWALPGQDDEVVAYHSSGGVSGSSGGTYCNPRDWYCNDLTTGTAVNQGGRPKWSFRSVVLRDDREVYDHYTRRNWQGVVAPLRAFMETYAY